MNLGMLAIGGGGGGSIKIPFLSKRIISMKTWWSDDHGHDNDEDNMITMMMTMMTWGVEGGEGPHSSAGSVAASPSLTIWSRYISSSSYISSI